MKVTRIRCPGSDTKANTQDGPWRGTCPDCGKKTQVKLDGTIRRHGTTRPALAAWRRHQQDPGAARVVCPWCTPERIRDAAEVLRQLDTGHDVYRTEYSWTPSQLDHKAVILERELTEAQVKREKRIEQLAAELHAIAGGSIPFDCIGTTLRDWYLPVARRLLDRYPALAEATDCGHPNHSNDGHDCEVVLAYREGSTL